MTNSKTIDETLIIEGELVPPKRGRGRPRKEHKKIPPRTKLVKGKPVTGEDVRILARRGRVWQLYLEDPNYNQNEIADIINKEYIALGHSDWTISYATVSRDLRDVTAIKTEYLKQEAETARHRHLHELRKVIKETWTGYESSKKDKKSTSKKNYTRNSGNTDNTYTADGEETTVNVEEQTTGDKTWLKLLLDALSQEGKILSIYAPDKIAFTNPDGTQLDEQDTLSFGITDIARATKFTSLLEHARARQLREGTDTP